MRRSDLDLEKRVFEGEKGHNRDRGDDVDT